ncbi:endogenous retrovirus group K, member 6 [Gossypium australe]|uniref:Endogenous retrovirus group K, member 6 n=1 Tax=Gossypium australe TaxID=47621 RepID=A0A5B6UYD7_9ROSI|nr:endogenous retrovirus group K, member 6 [Gossypium australe]
MLRSQFVNITENFIARKCRTKMGVCYRCGSTDHFVQNYPRMEEDNDERSDRQMSTPQKVRAPARTYAIRAREEAVAPDVIAGIFYLFDVTVYALIDPGSTHSYKSTGQSVLVNLICRKCLLKIQGYEFPANLMLLPFRDFDIILGMD